MVEYGRLENDYLVSREFESHHVRLIILGFFLSYLKQSNSNLSLRLHILFTDNRLILNHPLFSFKLNQGWLLSELPVKKKTNKHWCPLKFKLKKINKKKIYNYIFFFYYIKKFKLYIFFKLYKKNIYFFLYNYFKIYFLNIFYIYLYNI